MSLLTTVYKFIKPQLTDSPPDITAMNPNWDAIDAELNSHETQINNFASQVTEVTNANDATKGFSRIANIGINNPFPSFWSGLFTTNTPDVLYIQQFGFSWSSLNKINFAYRVKDNGVWGEWNKLVNSKQENWIATTLLNGWVNFGSGFYDVAYYKDNLGIVCLRGFIKNGVATAGTIILNLPVGYRSLNSIVFCTNSNNAVSTLQLQPNGDLIIQFGSNVSLSLDGISFRAEQ